MNIEPRQPTTKNPPERFLGDVWLEHLATPHTPDQRMTVARVRFAPGARTAWHCHARGQYLHVIAGIALFGQRDGTVFEVHPGETIYAAPGEDHWHSATADGFMEHLAMTEAGDDAATTTVWKEHVTDEEVSAAVTVRAG